MGIQAVKRTLGVFKCNVKGVGLWTQAAFHGFCCNFVQGYAVVLNREHIWRYSNLL